MNITLYQATHLANLESHIDEETGEIDIAAFEAAQITIAEKQRAYVAVIKNRIASLSMIDGAIKELQTKKKALESQQDRLKDALKASMKAINVTEIKALDCTFSAKLKLNFDESIHIEDGAIFPPELCLDPKPPEPSKSKIKSAILAGQPISGASIVRKDRLTIS